MNTMVTSFNKQVFCWFLKNQAVSSKIRLSNYSEIISQLKEEPLPKKYTIPQVKVTFVTTTPNAGHHYCPSSYIGQHLNRPVHAPFLSLASTIPTSLAGILPLICLDFPLFFSIYLYTIYLYRPLLAFIYPS